MENATTLSPYVENPTMFWGFAVLYLLLALFTVIGNGLVIAATYITEISDQPSEFFVPVRCFIVVIRSLAVSDMLYGFIGAPFQIYGYYLGKFRYNVNDYIYVLCIFI